MTRHASRAPLPSLAGAGLVLLTGIWWQLRFLSMPLGGDLHDFRQTQTAIVVREFMRHGFDWRTPLPLFGHDSNAPLEFPLFQGFAAKVAELLNLTPETATRTSGLFFFQLTVLLMWWLARRWFSRSTALWTLVLAEFLPYGTQWGHAALIDFMPTALVLLGVVLLEAGKSRTPRPWRGLIAASLTALLVLAFMVKVTTGVALAPLVFVPALGSWKGLPPRARLTSLLVPGAALAVALGAARGWTAAADHVKSGNPRTEFLTSAVLAPWNFGTKQQRLTLDTWTRILDGYWAAIVGGVTVLILLAVVAIVGWQWRPPVLVLAVTPLVGPLVFTNLYWVHSYYSMAVFPVLVLLAAASIGVAGERLASHRDRGFVGAAAAGALLLMAWMSPDGSAYRANLSAAHGPPALALEIQGVVPRGSGVIFLGCDWNPVIPFYADRPALMLGVAGTPVLTQDREELTGFSYIAFCNEPPGGFQAQLNTVLPAGYTATPVAPRVFGFVPTS